MQVALYTFGILRERREHEASRGFVDIYDETFAAATSSPGYVGHSTRDPVTLERSWQPWAQPRFVPEGKEEQAPASLSLWEDLESVFLYSYDGLHARALAGRRDWFVRPQWPSYVVWWTPAQPDYVQAVERLELLHDQGPTPRAFTFKNAFAADGSPYQMDQHRLAELRELRAP